MIVYSLHNLRSFDHQLGRLNAEVATRKYTCSRARVLACSMRSRVGLARGAFEDSVDESEGEGGRRAV